MSRQRFSYYLEVTSHFITDILLISMRTFNFMRRPASIVSQLRYQLFKVCYATGCFVIVSFINGQIIHMACYVGCLTKKNYSFDVEFQYFTIRYFGQLLVVFKHSMDLKFQQLVRRQWIVNYWNRH